MTTFQTRTLSATVFSIIMLSGLFFNEISFMLLFGAVAVGCLWEYQNHTLEAGVSRRVFGMLVGSILVLFFLIFPQFQQKSMLFLLVILPFVLLLFEMTQGSTQPFTNVAQVIFSYIYTILPFILLLEISFKDGFSPNLAAGILFLNWANDSGAYIIGSQIGKTPFAPRISPKKTWEGTIGGVLFCLLTAYGLSFLFQNISLTDWLVVGVLVGIFGTLGDLVESMLKRSLGIKDSGNIMPGHGGFLDRFDAFIFCVPFVWAYFSFF